MNVLWRYFENWQHCLKSEVISHNCSHTHAAAGFVISMRGFGWRTVGGSVQPGWTFRFRIARILLSAPGTYIHEENDWLMYTKLSQKGDVISADAVLVNQYIPQHQFHLSIWWEAAYATRSLITSMVLYSDTCICIAEEYCGGLPGILKRGVISATALSSQ